MQIQVTWGQASGHHKTSTPTEAENGLRAALDATIH